MGNKSCRCNGGLNEFQHQSRHRYLGCELPLFLGFLQENFRHHDGVHPCYPSHSRQPKWNKTWGFAAATNVGRPSRAKANDAMTNGKQGMRQKELWALRHKTLQWHPQITGNVWQAQHWYDIGTMCLQNEAMHIKTRVRTSSFEAPAFLNMSSLRSEVNSRTQSPSKYNNSFPHCWFL